MNRSHDERQDLREGVLNSANNRAMNPVMSASSIDKDKHDKQIIGKINSGNETSGYRAVDLIKPSKPVINSMAHVSVGSAPLPPIPPLQAPMLTSILPGPGHPLIPSGLSHASLMRGGALPAQIPLMGRAAAAVAPPRASVVTPSLRPSAIPPLKSTGNSNQIPIAGKGSSIFSPIVPSNRVPAPSVSNLSRQSEHARVMDTKKSHCQSEIHHVCGVSNVNSVIDQHGTATVQVIASGTASLAHPLPAQAKSLPVIPNQNVLKIGSPILQQSQGVTVAHSSTSMSTTTTLKATPTPNSIAIGKLFTQPILIPSTTASTPSTTRPDLQDHQRSSIASSTNHSRLSPSVTTTQHGSYAAHHHYGVNVTSYTSAHVPYTTNENKNDRLKPGNPAMQYTIGSYFPIDSAFPHSLGIHSLSQNSPFNPFVRPLSCSSSGLGSFPMFVEGTRGFAAPLPIPGMTTQSRDHHHSTSAESPTVKNNSFAAHNFQHLQPTSHHSVSHHPVTSNSSTSRPGILRKRAVDGYAIHSIDRISSPTKQEVRSETRSDSRPNSHSESLSAPRDSPKLLCEEKSVYNENITSKIEASTSSNISTLLPIHSELNCEVNTRSNASINQLTNSVHQNLISLPVSSITTTEASPRKKPRKQNVITTEDKYGSKVTIEEEEMENKINDRRKEIEADSGIIKIQKPVLKMKIEETVELKDKEQNETDEMSKYYTFIRKPKFSVFGEYKKNSKAAHHHFYRYSDVKAKEEKRPNASELANGKKVLQHLSGWRVHHMSSQMDDLTALENEVCNKLYEFQRELPRPSKHYMITTACHNIQNGKKMASIDEQLRVLHELIQGNIQRCQLGMEQIGEAKQTMLRVLDHKPRILEIIKRLKHKRSTKKKLPVS